MLIELIVIDAYFETEWSNNFEKDGVFQKIIVKKVYLQAVWLF